MDKNRRMNELRREAITQGIGSPSYQMRYINARLRGCGIELSKISAYAKGSQLGE